MKGQTLLEVLIALAISVVVISAITASVIFALSNAQYSKFQNLATQYAQEGMEVVRKNKNSDYNNFKNLSGNYCIKKDSMILESRASCNQNVDIFVRGADIHMIKTYYGNPSCELGQMKATVYVRWSDSKCPASDVFCHKVELVSCFSDFNTAPAP